MQGPNGWMNGDAAECVDPEKQIPPTRATPPISSDAFGRCLWKFVAMESAFFIGNGKADPNAHGGSPRT